MSVKIEIRLDENELLKAYNDGLSDTQISKMFKVFPATIMRWRSRNNLPMLNDARRAKVLQGKEIKLLQLYNEGLTDAQMGRIFKVAPRTIRNWRERNNLPRTNFYYCSNKLAGKDAELLQAYNEKMSEHKIAKKFNVSMSVINKWMKKRGLKSHFPSPNDYLQKPLNFDKKG